MVGLAAIALINGGGGIATRGARAAVGMAVLAGIAFGLFFILFQGASAAGVTAFVSGRIGSAIGAFCFALLSRSAFVPNRSVWRLLAFGGTFDGIGVVLYLYATFHGLLSLSALLTSFYSRVHRSWPKRSSARRTSTAAAMSTDRTLPSSA